MSGDQATTESPVIVAGAGPVGMAAAIALDARNIPVTILEQDAEDRRRPGSRAIYVHGDTLQMLERNSPGLGKRLAEEGIVWPTRRTLFRGKEVFSRTYSNPGGSGNLPHFTSIPQAWTEDFLLDAIVDAGIEINWETSVETVETSEDGVHVESEDGRVWDTPYLVGADGAGSQVRKEIGSEFVGDQSENSFIIADVTEHPDEQRPLERIFHYDHPGVGERNVLIVPFKSGWRVDIQCLDDDDPDYLASDSVLEGLVGTIMGERYRDRVDWVSTYQFLQVTADSMVDEHRRVLLVGEAGHLFAPFGARGMNSGVADAEEAASAIAVGLQAQDRSVARAEVEKYDTRRGTAAEWNKNAAGQALKYLQGDSPITKAKKRLAATAADYYEPAGEWLDDAPYGPHGSPPTSVGQY